MKKFGKYGALLACGLLLTACGSDDDDSGTKASSSELSTGVFVDAAVGGVDYSTGSQQGITNEKGEFQYTEGENITFSIGDLVFPSVKAGGTITPLEIANTEDINSNKVINMIRLLISLDEDGDPSNGITITEMAKASATVVNFDLPVEEFAASDAVVAVVSNAGQNTQIQALVSVEVAKTHFQKTLDDIKASSTEYANYAGIYNLSDGEADYGGILNIYPNGRYLIIEYDTEYTDESGFEYGDIGLKDGQLNPNITIDTNGVGGLSDAEFTNVKVTGNTLTMTLTEPDGEVEQLEFTKESLANSIAGSWSAEEGSVSFNFLPNGEYFLVQVIDSEAAEGEDGDIGIEAGTYTFDSGLLVLSAPLIDTSGGSLMSDEGSQSIITSSTISDDGQTLTIVLDSNDSEEGTVSVVLTRKL